MTSSSTCVRPISTPPHKAPPHPAGAHRCAARLPAVHPHSLMPTPPPRTAYTRPHRTSAHLRAVNGRQRRSRCSAGTQRATGAARGPDPPRACALRTATTPSVSQRQARQFLRRMEAVRLLCVVCPAAPTQSAPLPAGQPRHDPVPPARRRRARCAFVLAQPLPLVRPYGAFPGYGHARLRRERASRGAAPWRITTRPPQPRAAPRDEGQELPATRNAHA
ncbi:hypothetical protein HYPSUDRAFT_204724 [Hypholoma sublateritium FD-334 SS-4]|uniref:Uncharacterized protein n=1 Tax=Hypholoma sublateritium (strain FD-334 SS-4) TaxID=945553 RepID=A0A0D2M7V3_HYPSF|nr:hypothetical protein HYPSUDRAFT_204724 [Hypholoma sublateritium FD-334 SS-4]